VIINPAGGGEDDKETPPLWPRQDQRETRQGRESCAMLCGGA